MNAKEIYKKEINLKVKTLLTKLFISNVTGQLRNYNDCFSRCRKKWDTCTYRCTTTACTTVAVEGGQLLWPCLQMAIIIIIIIIIGVGHDMTLAAHTVSVIAW